jgi:glycosyltransferase involved in cell wall biosynthesis
MLMRGQVLHPFFSGKSKTEMLSGCRRRRIAVCPKTVLCSVKFLSNRSLMVRRLYTSIRYRRALSQLLIEKIRRCRFEKNTVAIQLGAMFNIHDAFPAGCLRMSYNDGNFISALNSPYFPRKDFSTKMIDAAVEYERDVQSGFDAVLTMSEFLRQSFIHDYGIAEEKVHCIGCGVNLKPDVVADMLSHKAAEKQYDNPDILFIGVDFLRKGGLTVLEAFRSVRQTIPNARLHIIGPRIPAEGFENEPGVIWYGFLHKNKESEAAVFNKILRQCSLFVMPSVYEPFGIAPLEAMLNGIPCIVTNRWALCETVPAGKVGENVEPDDAEELAAKILHLFQNPVQLQEYGAACRPWVESQFRWNKVVDRLETFLQEKFPVQYL